MYGMSWYTRGNPGICCHQERDGGPVKIASKAVGSADTKRDIHIAVTRRNLLVDLGVRESGYETLA